MERPGEGIYKRGKIYFHRRRGGGTPVVIGKEEADELIKAGVPFQDMEAATAKGLEAGRKLFEERERQRQGSAQQ